MGMDDKSFVKAQYRRAEKEIAPEKIDEMTNAKTRRWRELVAEEIPLFEGMENFIRKMEKDFALGLVSMARREEIEYVLETLNLRDCFSTIVSAEDITDCKPDPESYLKGFTRLDAARTARGHNPIVHGECLVIEDAPQGIIAGKRAGLKTLGVPNTVDAKTLREAGADAVTDKLPEWMPGAIRRVFV
jgi:HAD superfamily hydrolase (TIGR01509 family)